MMRLKKIISFTLALLLLSITLVGCSVVRYDAELYSYVNDWLDPAFLENNRLGNVNYRNPDYDRDLADEAYDEGREYEVPRFFNYPDNPETRSFIITDQETFDSMFVEDAIEVDFEKEMVLLYMFRTGASTSRNYKIEEITVEEGEMSISVTYAWNWDVDVKGVANNIYPYHRCMAVKMKKAEVTTADFIEA